MTTKFVRPFSNGTEFGEWEEHNCGNCWKSYLNSKNQATYRCRIDEALGTAYVGTGQVTEKIYKRMGGDSGVCTEREEKRPPRVRRAPKLENTPLFKKPLCDTHQNDSRCDGVHVWTLVD